MGWGVVCAISETGSASKSLSHYTWHKKVESSGIIVDGESSCYKTHSFLCDVFLTEWLLTVLATITNNDLIGCWHLSTLNHEAFRVQDLDLLHTQVSSYIVSTGLVKNPEGPLVSLLMYIVVGWKVSDYFMTSFCSSTCTHAQDREVQDLYILQAAVSNQLNLTFNVRMNGLMSRCIQLTGGSHTLLYFFFNTTGHFSRMYANDAAAALSHLCLHALTHII